MILIVTSSNDSTVDYIIEKYNKENVFFRLNVDKIYEYIFNINVSDWSITYDDFVVRKQDIRSIYYRKPSFPSLSHYDVRYHLVIKRDIMALINGIVDDFEGIVLTKPSILRKVENKVYQLLNAHEYGLLMPRSYIVNSYDGINFMYNNIIIKPVTSNGKLLPIYTNYLEMDEDKDKDIRVTPIYLQQYIKKEYEVRVVIMADVTFAVRIDCNTDLDWRRDYENHKYRLIKCPEKIKQQCLKMMKSWEISFAAIDFIVNDNNEWFFLEVNPNGQWLWLEL